MNFLKIIIICFILNSISEVNAQQVIPAANKIESYINYISNNKKIGVVCNQTSKIGETHLIDTLLSLGVNIHKIFGPEHGFRGGHDAGELVNSGKDEKTGIDVVSLYGEHKKPNRMDFVGLQYIVFDIQDVGVRFYTYISTLQYVLESCAEFNVPIIVLDRPNPNGHYVDGPILEEKYRSFIGLQSVPIVYGMTIGEYAKMITYENWLENAVRPQLKVIPCDNYTHKTKYSLPIAPSPNLKSDLSIALYPSLCLFEGTNVSVGRGTDRPFEMFGSPYFVDGVYPFSFIPSSTVGAKNPFMNGLNCIGMDLANFTPKDKLEVSFVIDAFKSWNQASNKNFFLTNMFFDKLAGNSKLRTMIEQGKTEDEIRDSWKNDMELFLRIRKRNLIYEDF